MRILAEWEVWVAKGCEVWRSVGIAEIKQLNSITYFSERSLETVAVYLKENTFLLVLSILHNEQKIIYTIGHPIKKIQHPMMQCHDGPHATTFS